MKPAEFRAVVSHPSKQGNMYRVPMGAQESGIPVDFLTGLYYRPDRRPFTWLRLLPKDRRPRLEAVLERRRLDGLDAAVHMVSGPLPELAYRLFGYRVGNAVHDRLASLWLERRWRRGGRGLFHGFQESCAASLRTAGRLGLARLLESTLPPSTSAIVAAEHRRLGLAWSGPCGPSRELLAELALADYHIAQSRFAAHSLIEHGVEPGRVFLMPLGVDIGRFTPPPADAAPEGPFRALFTGQLTVRKGVHHLLRAWSILGLGEAELLFAGVAREPYVLDLVRRAGGCHRYLGFVPHAQLPQTYRQADIFVLPSLAEGGVYVVYEALAAGLPCVVSENAGSAVRDGVEGFVVPVGDVEALAARIRRLHDDIELRRRMGRAARARAELFSWPSFYRRIGVMYREAMARGSSAAPDIFDLFER